MKLTRKTDIENFFKAVDKCEGRVELVTPKGDCLDLKSKFNQYVAMIKFLTEEPMDEMKILAELETDMQKLAIFMLDE